MATPREWADAFLQQARADLRAVHLVQSEPSVFAMLLQMTFEKFAKAALLRSGQIAVGARTHHAASRMVHIMRRQREVIAPLGGPWPWDAVFRVIDDLERAHPTLAGPRGPHLEYPWEDAEGRIRSPARDLQVARSLTDPIRNLGSRTLNFVILLDQRFDQIFP